MKKKIFENRDLIKARQRYADELVTTVNSLIIRFKEQHNHFGQVIDESFSIQLLTDPVGTFDELLRVNSPIKPIAGKAIDASKLAELTGIDRKGFISEFAVILPGSKDQFNRHGVLAFFKLNPADRDILTWKDGSFVLNERALALQLESYRVYAETPEQCAEAEYWENLCSTLNTHLDRKAQKPLGNRLPGERPFIDQPDIAKIAILLGFKCVGGRFEVDSKALSETIKSMALLN